MAELVKLSIDGREVEVPKGTTVLKAAESLGIEIPHLCFLEGIAPGGACRLCVVEVDGGRLMPACTLRVRDGMDVRTSTPRVTEARRFVLELIWSIHPNECTTCEKAGACELQRYTYEIGLERRPPVELPEKPPVDRESPLIERDLRLCILCGRCIFACRELSEGILDYVRRGMQTLVTTPFGKRLDEVGCDFCGSCIEACPVGCLVERDRKFRGREWEFSPTTTTCTLCSAGCELVLEIGKGEPVRARPGADGLLCVRGKFGWDFLLSEERLEHPLIREGDRFREASWDEAIEFVAQRLVTIRDQEGPEIIGGIAGGWLTIEALYAFGKLFRDVLGSGNLGVWGLDMRAETALSLPGKLLPVKALEGARTILAVGAALGESFQRAGVAVRRALKRGAKLVVLDPLNSDLARRAVVHLAPKPGTEAIALRALDQALSGTEPGADGHGIPPEKLAEAAEALKDGFVAVLGPGAISMGNRLAEKAEGIVVLSPWANWWGALAAGIHPSLAAGPRKTEVVGLSPQEMLKETSPIKALFVLGADPAGEGWEIPDLDFLVVADLFLTETAKKADVVFPLKGPFENEGRILVPEVRELRPIARRDIPQTWNSIAGIIKRAGADWKPSSADEIWREIEEALVSEPTWETSELEGVSAPSEGRAMVPVYFRFALPSRAWTHHSALRDLVPNWDTVAFPPDELGDSGEGSEVVLEGHFGRVSGKAWAWKAIPAGAVALVPRGGRWPMGKEGQG